MVPFRTSWFWHNFDTLASAILYGPRVAWLSTGRLAGPDRSRRRVTARSAQACERGYGRSQGERPLACRARIGATPVSALGPLAIESRDVIIGGADLWGQEAWRCAEY